MKIFTVLKWQASLLAILLLMKAVAVAEQVVHPELDGFIRSNSNIGWFIGEGLLIGDTGQPLEDRSMNALLKFDLSELDPEKEIATVALVLISRAHSGNESAAPVTFELYRCKRRFSPVASWQNYAAERPWGAPGGTSPDDIGPLLGSQTVSTADYKMSGQVLEFSGSAAFVEEVKRARVDGEPLYLWIGLKSGEEEGTGRHILDLASTEYGSRPDHPQLVVGYASQ